MNGSQGTRVTIRTKSRPSAQNAKARTGIAQEKTPQPSKSWKRRVANGKKTRMWVDPESRHDHAPNDSAARRRLVRIQLLKLSETTVRRMCERKELPAVKFGSQWRIRRKDVLAMFDQPA